MIFKQHMIKLREDKSLSQQQLADALSVHRQTISRWELGQTQPNIEQLILIADYYDLSLDQLVNKTEPKQTQSDFNMQYVLFFIESKCNPQTKRILKRIGSIQEHYNIGYIINSSLNKQQVIDFIYNDLGMCEADYALIMPSYRNYREQGPSLKIGENIERLRNEQQISQETLAMVLSVKRQTVSKWESHKSEPDLQTMIAISNYFSISLEQLIRPIYKSENHLRMSIFFPFFPKEINHQYLLKTEGAFNKDALSVLLVDQLSEFGNCSFRFKSMIPRNKFEQLLLRMNQENFTLIDLNEGMFMRIS